MINLLFLLATAQAAEVYEFCSTKKQTWSDRYQKFETIEDQNFYGNETIQFILYKDSFEIDRDRRSIIETTEKNGMTCWREHANSEICYDKANGRMLWEWNIRSGATLRDILYVCKINGG